jgi:hypothetical protein
MGHGDLRPYILVQAGMILLSLLIFVLYRAPYPSGKAFAALFVFYLVAKILETFDIALWNILGQTLSGHSLKHFVASAGCWIFIKKF